MTAMIVPQEVVDSQLAQCADGETGDFTIKGGTFKMVPGLGAVISGDTITKSTYTEPSAPAPAPAVPKMSPTAAAVVKRQPAY